MNLFQEGYKLYYRQMVAHLRIDKEMCLSQMFPLFCQSPVHKHGNPVRLILNQDSCVITKVFH